MKRILCASLITVTLAAPALAAKLYLKDGGVIKAKRVWRSGGKVYVLATRDTETSFEPNEVDLKRTFPKQRHKVVHKKKKKIRAAHPAITGTAPATETTTTQPAAKTPETSAPSSGNGSGAIRQHKKAMEENLAQ